MLIAPDIDPVLIRFPTFTLPLIGAVSLKVHWYGIMYAVGFLGGWWLGVRRTRRPGIGWQQQEVGDLLFYCIIGVVLGGRLGYVLFYNAAYYFSHPAQIIAVWDGGMSFHGGLLGIIVAMWFYGRKTERGFLVVTDFLAPLCPLGLGAGRIGNFINQELWGKATNMPWGMVFERAHQQAVKHGVGPDPGTVPRHPSQLYEFMLEGVLLFIIIWWFANRPRPAGAVSGLFLLVYGISRFVVEFFRQPDAHIGYLAFDWLTLGQLLSVPMVAIGAWLLWRSGRFYSDPTLSASK